MRRACRLSLEQERPREHLCILDVSACEFEEEGATENDLQDRWSRWDRHPPRHV